MSEQGTSLIPASTHTPSRFQTFSSPFSKTIGSILCLTAVCVHAVCTACEHNAVIVASVPFPLPMLRMSQPEPAPDAYISHNEAGGLDRRLGRVGDTMYTAALGI